MKEQFFITKNLTKKFRDFIAVNNVTIELKKGNITAIIGPNGAGKTTFINLCSGLLKPDNGRIYFKNQDITKYKIYKRIKFGISRTFQIINIFPRLSVEDNVKIAALSIKKKSEDVKNIVNNSLHLFNLYSARYKHAEKLSHGDQRLLEICMAIVLEPELLFLDEPLAGINPTERGFITKVILNLKEKGITIVVVEHDIETVFKIADEIIVMHRGEIIAKDSPSQIKNNERVKKIYLGE